MGLAEVVPGVSGGTMALITGIYERLIDTIASFSHRSVVMLLRPTEFYVHHNLSFLLPLMVGMMVGVFVFAQVMGYLLDHYKPVVWSFFCGVILTSVVVIGRRRRLVFLATYGVLGLVLALALVLLTASQFAATPLSFFLGGMVAVSAWILPAVSGSYIMLILGLYEPALAALRNLDWLLLSSLVVGCAVGLLSFVRLLNWLIKHWYEQLLALLTGFMLGSVVNLWPWQQVAASSLERIITPSSYAALGHEPFILLVIAALVLGSLFLWLVSKDHD